jgi:hypothetical protein
MSYTSAHTSKADLESLLKRVGNEMKLNAEVQQELLKATTQYKHAVESLAAASDKIAQICGKLAVNTMSAFQTSKEYRMATGSMTVASSEAETKQKNLNLALQQVVKFHTLLAQQQQNVSHSLYVDFERPIQTNLASFKEVIANWDKELSTEMKRLQHDIKQKEKEASNVGKKVASKDMNKLSSSLAELSIKINELQHLRHEQIENALVTNTHHYFLVAHHLQQVLKTEVHACRTVYYQDGAIKSKSRDSRLTMNNQGSVSLPASPVRQNVPFVHEKMSKSSLALPQDISYGHNNQGTYPKSPLSPMAPVRRSSLDDDKEEKAAAASAVSSVRNPSIMAEYLQKQQKKSNVNDGIQQSGDYLVLRNPPPPLKMAPIKTSPLPSIPSNPHRRTQIIPSGLNVEELNEFIDSAFGLDENAETLLRTAKTATVKGAKISKAEIEKRKSKKPLWELSATGSCLSPDVDSFNKMTLYESSDHTFKYDSTVGYQDTLKRSTMGKQTIISNNSEGSLSGADLVLVLYDYVGEQMDDLNVIEGDILRVIAAEGEWLYGLLLAPVSEDSGEYEPAEIDGKHQVGWVPYSFTTPLQQ